MKPLQLTPQQTKQLYDIMWPEVVRIWNKRKNVEQKIHSK